MPEPHDQYGLPPLKSPYGRKPPDDNAFLRGVIWGALVIAVAFILVLVLGVV